jgi:hypothetical protein
LPFIPKRKERKEIYQGRTTGLKGQCTYLAIVCIVDRKAADELPVLVAGHFELALELEEEEFG